MWLNNNNLIAGIVVADEVTSLLAKEKKTQDDWDKIKVEYEKLRAKDTSMKSWEEFMDMT